MSYYSRKLNLPFQDVMAKVTENLHKQGFGIITRIDVKETFNQKLNVKFRNYNILGACNPQFAFQAISLESHMGVLLPCNIVVQEHENGDVEVSAINPLAHLDPALYTQQLHDLGREVGKRLRDAIDGLSHDLPREHHDALPVDGLHY